MPPAVSDQLVGRFSQHEPTTIHQQWDLRSRSSFSFFDGNVNATAYSTVLNSCSHPRLGKQVHAHLIKTGFEGREFVGTNLIRMYGKFGCLEDVVQVFEKMSERNLYTYTAILNVFLDDERFDEAFLYLQELLFEDIAFEFFIFPVAIKICWGFGGVELGRQLHGMVLKTGYFSHIYIGNALIDMYGKCGSLNDANNVLLSMPKRDCISWNSMVIAFAANDMVFEALKLSEVMSREKQITTNHVSWNALISGFIRNGYDEEAIEILRRMLAAGCDPNARCLASVLPACARLRKLSMGKEIFGYITRHKFMSTPYACNGLIDLHRRCGDMSRTLRIFSSYSSIDEVSFNTMIAGYCDNGEIQKAKELFDQMDCEGIRKDLISWNSMISGLADNFKFTEAIEAFSALIQNGEIEPNSFTLGSVLGACADSGCLRLGKTIHSYCLVKGFQMNLFVGGALVDMYCRCRELEDAEKAFTQVPVRDFVIWNALISGYSHCNRIESVQTILQLMKNDGFEPNTYTWNVIMSGYVENDHNELALQLFLMTQASSNWRPDIYSVGIVLTACSKLATLTRGKQIHAYAIRCGFDSDAYITAALVDMYAKCGMITSAKNVHDRINRNRNLVTQNAMLNAYAIHGYGEDGIGLFCEMLVNGFMPDKVTFLAVLSACVHVGSVDTGLALFGLMGYYGVTPTLKHYTCVVDLLSRAGKLEQAWKVIESMPMKGDRVIWSALLGGCVVHGDVDLGEMAAQKVMKLESENLGNSVMLENLYFSSARWHEVANIRELMKCGKVWKNPGYSWIEDRDETHRFMACDRSHKLEIEIYSTLDNLTAHIRLEEEAIA